MQPRLEVPLRQAECLELFTNMSKLLGTIEGCDILEQDDGSVTYVAKMAIDNDGSQNQQHDPDWQADTSLHFKGKPIDSEAVPGVVVPPRIQNGVEGIVLGCQAEVSYRGKTVKAVVFDIGPRRKIGEGSPELARRLGIDPSPTHGGVDEHEVHYYIFPGQAAVVDGITYDLQPA